MTRFRIEFRPRPLHFWILALSGLMAAGAVAGVMVFAKGLTLTNLSDIVPWGLWITIDLTAIALSAGAFTLCAIVYLVGLKQYEPLARTATFIGLIGYSMAMLMLLLDIGRPDRFWHGFVYWNTHSVLWEVTMCVGLYMFVLMFEYRRVVSFFTAPIFAGCYIWGSESETAVVPAGFVDSFHRVGSCRGDRANGTGIHAIGPIEQSGQSK